MPQIRLRLGSNQMRGENGSQNNGKITDLRLQHYIRTLRWLPTLCICLLRLSVESLEHYSNNCYPHLAKFHLFKRKNVWWPIAIVRDKPPCCIECLTSSGDLWNPTLLIGYEAVRRHSVDR